MDALPWVALVAAVAVLLSVDWRFFARGREPDVREAIWWSVGWTAIGLAVALAVLALKGAEDAVLYTTVYLIERTLSLDNVFVFLVLFSYFGVPYSYRSHLLMWGIAGAVVMRAAFIVVGSALVERFHFLIYVLGALLLVMAYRAFKGMEEHVDPGDNVLVRTVRRLYPVANEIHGPHWFVKRDGRRYATPLFLCLTALVFADLAFAIDSIPAAFAITRDPLLIWMANAFALLGLRSLFVLVEGLIARFRYLDETIAVVLGLVGAKLLLEDVVEIEPVVSLIVVAVAFGIGIWLSVRAERRKRDRQAVGEPGRAS